MTKKKQHSCDHTPLWVLSAAPRDSGENNAPRVSVAAAVLDVKAVAVYAFPNNNQMAVWAPKERTIYYDQRLDRFPAFKARILAHEQGHVGISTASFWNAPRHAWHDFVDGLRLRTSTDYFQYIEYRMAPNKVTRWQEAPFMFLYSALGAVLGALSSVIEIGASFRHLRLSRGLPAVPIQRTKEGGTTMRKLKSKPTNKEACDHSGFYLAIVFVAGIAIIGVAAMIGAQKDAQSLGDAICNIEGKGAFVAIDGDTLACQPPASEARPFAGLIIKEGDP